MTDGYEIKPPDPVATPSEGSTGAISPEPISTASSAGPKPGDPGWIPPTVIVERAPDVEEEAPADPDVEKNKGIAVLGYVCFLVPLVLAPNSKFARFHANQGLLAFIYLIMAVVFVVALQFLRNLNAGLEAPIYVLYAFFSCMILLLQPALLLAWVGMVIYGIIQAANGERKGLPLVGQWTLIK